MVDDAGAVLAGRRVVLGLYAGGLSGDLLTATLLATRAPVVVAPAMHTEMWEHPAVRRNVATLRGRGVAVVEPESGRLAGGDVGEGRLAAPESIVAAVVAAVAGGRDLAGVRVLVTAGGTREPIDAVRSITNRSSGKMGHAVVEAAHRRGAAVTLITTVERPVPPGVERIEVETAEQMARAVLDRAPSADVVVMAAAVADFRPKAPFPAKLKKRDGLPEIVLEPTPDILAALGEAKRPGQVLVGFAAETDEVLANAAAKLAAKNVDLMVANDVSAVDAGFGVDTNRAILLYPHDRGLPAEETPLLSKEELADLLLDRIAAPRGKEPR